MQLFRALFIHFLKIAIIFAIIASVWKMSDIALPYLQSPYPTNIDFLQDKQAEVQLTHWLIAFYIHITTSAIALAMGLLQFSSSILQQFPRVHRLAGMIYVGSILLLAAPTGLVMGFYGEGGILAQIAFVCQALAWWGTTYMAYHHIRQHNIALHGAWIIRSYAVAMSAISLRGISYLLYWLREWNGWVCPDTYAILCHPTSYIFIAWFSWIFNWLVAEVLIRMGILRYYGIKTA
jgi:hypothetical protein